MQVTRNSLDTAAGVHFTPGARTHWHTHPLGQTIYVIGGSAVASARASP
jgi:quercetin dioxygenase-like cupin family protein